MNLQNLAGDLGNQVIDEPNAQQNEQAGASSRISSALSSMGGTQVSNAVSGLASELSSGQRGNLVGSLLGSLGAAGVNVQSLLGRLGINPAVADNPEQASPEDAAAIAVHAHENHPGILQGAMSFYEQHPTLIKTLGLFTAAAVAQHVYDGGKQQA